MKLQHPWYHMKDKLETGTDRDDCDGGCIGGMYSVDAMSLVRHSKFDTEAQGGERQDTIGELLGQFPKGKGGGEGGGRRIRGRDGGKKMHHCESIRSFGGVVFIFTSYFWRNHVPSQSARVPVPLFVPPPTRPRQLIGKRTTAAAIEQMCM